MPSWGMDGLPGNAIDWSNRARMAGIRVSTTPKVDAVANWLYQPYGHVAFVEAVNPDGTVLVSEYNYVTPGRYDERLLTPGESVMPDDYIYF
jgi:surface antigen